MKAIKIILGIVVLLIALLAAALISLSFLVDPNRLKPVLINEVAKKTDYQLAIEGQLSWRLYPVFGIHVAHMSLKAPKQISPFLDLYDVTIATKLTALVQNPENISGELRIAKASLSKLQLQDVSVDMNWRAQQLTLNPISAKLYEGRLTGLAHGKNLTTSQPLWDWDVLVDRVQLKSLLNDINGAESRVKLAGVARVALKARAQGASKRDIFASLNGMGSLDIQQGVLEGINLNYFVMAADALINKQAIPVPAEIAQTQFNSLNGNLVIKNGVVGTNDMQLVTPSLKAIATGEINLNYNTMNLSLNVSPENVKTNWEIPVLMIGDVGKPDVRLDMTEINKFILKQHLEKVRDKISQEVDKVPGEAGKFLKKLIGN